MPYAATNILDGSVGRAALAEWLKGLAGPACPAHIKPLCSMYFHPGGGETDDEPWAPYAVNGAITEDTTNFILNDRALTFTTTVIGSNYFQCVLPFAIPIRGSVIVAVRLAAGSSITNIASLVLSLYADETADLTKQHRGYIVDATSFNKYNLTTAAWSYVRLPVSLFFAVDSPTAWGDGTAAAGTKLVDRVQFRLQSTGANAGITVGGIWYEDYPTGGIVFFGDAGQKQAAETTPQYYTELLNRGWKANITLDKDKYTDGVPDSIHISLDLATELQDTHGWEVGVWNGPEVWKPGEIVAISKAANATVTFNLTHAYVVGQRLTFHVQAGMVEIDGLTGVVLDADPTGDGKKVTVDINSSGFTPYAYTLGDWGKVSASHAVATIASQRRWAQRYGLNALFGTGAQDTHTVSSNNLCELYEAAGMAYAFGINQRLTHPEDSAADFMVAYLNTTLLQSAVPSSWTPIDWYNLWMASPYGVGAARAAAQTATLLAINRAAYNNLVCVIHCHQVVPDAGVADSETRQTDWDEIAALIESHQAAGRLTNLTLGEWHFAATKAAVRQDYNGVPRMEDSAGTSRIVL